ncbi:hypothetical protein EON63_12005 [archaeon]|nr:MAG: hypothetical protein EON63_12005 [archaeon]
MTHRYIHTHVHTHTHFFQVPLTITTPSSLALPYLSTPTPAPTLSLFPSQLALTAGPRHAAGPARVGEHLGLCCRHVVQLAHAFVVLL